MKIHSLDLPDGESRGVCSNQEKVRSLALASIFLFSPVTETTFRRLPKTKKSGSFWLPDFFLIRRGDWI